MKVRECSNSGGWNIAVLIELVGETKIEEILALKVVCRQDYDRYIWTPKKDGNFTKSSAWEVTRLKGEKHEWMKWIWHRLIPKKISLCMWNATFLPLTLACLVVSVLASCEIMIFLYHKWGLSINDIRNGISTGIFRYRTSTGTNTETWKICLQPIPNLFPIGLLPGWYRVFLYSIGPLPGCYKNFYFRNPLVYCQNDMKIFEAFFYTQLVNC